MAGPPYKDQVLADVSRAGLRGGDPLLCGEGGGQQWSGGGRHDGLAVD